MKKRFFVFTLVWVVLIFLAPSASAFDSPQHLPEDAVIFEPGVVLETDFGSFTVLDAGFTKKAVESVLLSSPTGERTSSYYTAKDGAALFAVLGILKNTSDTAVTIRSYQPILHYSVGRTVYLIAFPNAPVTSPEYRTLPAGAEIEVVMFSDVPNVLYDGNEDFYLECFGRNLGFLRSDIRNYASIGFSAQDGVPVDDVYMISETGSTTLTAAEKPHVDEVGIEGVRLEKTKGKEYKLHAKIRNHYIPEDQRNAPTNIMIAFQLLDSSGDAIPVNSSIFVSDLESGQGGWCTSPARISADALEQAAKVKFYKYELRWSGAYPDIKGTFGEPLIYTVEELLNDQPVVPAKNNRPNDISVENVSVEFSDKLPESVQDVIPGSMKEALALGSGQVFAMIRFTLTNLTKNEFKLADASDVFTVQLNYDDGFIFSTEDKSEFLFESEGRYSLGGEKYVITAEVMNVIAPPLTEMDVTLYLPVARAVSTGTDKPLVVSFITDFAEKQQIDVKIR